MMRRAFLAGLLVLALAAAAFGATGSATWDGSAADGDWENDANWTPAQHPADGDLATFDGSEGENGLPSANFPGIGLTINVRVDADYHANTLPDDFIGTDATLGAVVASGPSGGPSCILASSPVSLHCAGGGIGTPGGVIVAAGTTITPTGTVSGYTPAAGIVLCGGKIEAQGAGVVLNSNITIGADGGVVDFGNGNLTIQGWFTRESGTETVIFTNTTGATVTVDNAGTINPGVTTANGVTWDIQAATTLGGSFTCHMFTTSGAATPVLTGGGFTVTVGAGGVDEGGMTLASGGSLNIILSATTSTVKWPTAASRLGTLTVNAGATATQSGTVYFAKRDGTGTLAGGSQLTYCSPAADGDTCNGPFTGTGSFIIQPFLTPLTCASVLNVGTRPVLSGYAVASRVLTINGLTCGALTVSPGGTTELTVLTINGPSSGTNIVLGTAGGASRSGALVLSPGYSHTWTGTVAVAGAGTANALTLGGTVSAGGNWTLAGITTALGNAKIDATAAVTITGTSATAISAGGGCIVTGRGGAVTLTDLNTNWAGGRVLARRWVDGTGNGTVVQTAAPHWMGVR